MNNKLINKVILGDCLNVMVHIENNSVDMVCCDLPYQVTSRNQWDSIIPFFDLWKAYERVIKKNGAIVLTSIQPFTSFLICSNPKLFKYEWIWQKSRPTGFLNANRQPLRNHESILVFYKNQPTYNPQGIIDCNIKCNRGSADRVGTNYNQANPIYTQTKTGYPKTVQLFASEGKTQHPTQKPVKLCEYLIATYTKESDLVLDNCAGSGSTLIAAKNLNRNYIGIEKNPNYYKIIQERLKNG